MSNKDKTVLNLADESASQVSGGKKDKSKYKNYGAIKISSDSSDPEKTQGEAPLSHEDMSQD